jgi:hypothetical protein
MNTYRVVDKHGLVYTGTDEARAYRLYHYLTAGEVHLFRDGEPIETHINGVRTVHQQTVSDGGEF